MPKEIIHFTVAELTARKLAGTDYEHHLKNHQSGLLLGSVLHDVLFYATGKQDSQLEKLAHVLHGAKGQDTYTLLRLQVNHIAACDFPGLAIALLVGMVSHLYADVVMHPMVWHISGDYYENDARERSLARQRHRALESLMDMVVAPKKIGLPRYSVKGLANNLGHTLLDAIPIARLAEIAAMDTAAATQGMERALTLHGRLQHLFSNSQLSRLLFSLRRLLPAAAKEVAALFYSPQLLRQSDTLRGDISYRHPVTGEEYTASLQDLMAEAAERSAELLTSVAPAIFSGASLDIDTCGPSLDAGIKATPTTSMRHFANPPFPELT